MALNKSAAAYLAYFAYIDDGSDAVEAADFASMLAQVPPGEANGPWTLTWGPAINDGTLAYVARGADGTYGLAFRGTDADASVTGSFQDLLEDAEFRLLPWLYPQRPGAPLRVSAGTNQALALAVALTDPALDLSLLDYVRSVAAPEPLVLIVAGHSLGGALAVAATAWLEDQLGKAGEITFSLFPHSFAAPTAWNPAFAAWFAETFTYYAATNTLDIVPMAWANLRKILATYPSPGPSLREENPVLHAAIEAASVMISGYGPIATLDADVFQGRLEDGLTWEAEAGLMHSMAKQYFPHATGRSAPPLPNTATGGLAKPRRAEP